MRVLYESRVFTIKFNHIEEEIGKEKLPQKASLASKHSLITLLITPRGRGLLLLASNPIVVRLRILVAVATTVLWRRDIFMGS